MSSELYNFQVLDLNGKIVYSSQIQSNTAKHMNLPAGIYLYAMTSERSNENALRGKLTIL
jgi:hypothetical protein